MATPTSIRPVIGRTINYTRLFSNANISSLAILPTASSVQSRCPFSTTPERSMRRPRRDGNRLRGLSSIYRSGPRFRMNIDKSEVPQPADFKPEIKVDPNHGLWDFFYDQENLLLKPDEEADHGRGWSVEELRHKSWDDLHRLWWVCVKEQNRIATARKERSRMQLKTGTEETAERLAEVRKTMKAIKHTLTERYYLWEDARKLGEADPEVNLSAIGNAYTPSDYLDPAMYESAPEQVEAGEGTRQQIAGGGAEAEPLTEPSTTQPQGVDPSTMPPKDTDSPQSPARPLG
ncbi:Uu.00g019230.m01.CDS01 [Anthostomella pinea]|uniref:Large ribosomal subunit protein uL29m n=1 Tax=Anthostomella pinea TaxID=933095 RepID=A0AAI8YQL9_9PEZI|nr:Uu.00g019230.m01.CDS01 [Anthostomella pinea]